MAGEKVAVIGAGQVGATTAQRVIENDLADVVLIDIVEGLAQGKALDMMQSAPVVGINRTIVGGTDLSLVEGSDVVVVTAGKPRKPGMSREDLLKANAEIVSGIAEAVAQNAPDSKVIVVTNPLDVMTHLMLKKTHFSPERVMGMAGALDSARFAFFVADDLHVLPSQVNVLVLGGHGDLMVPLSRLSTVAGVPLSELLPPQRIEAIVERTRAGGAEIVELLKAGSAFYAPSAAAARMVSSILHGDGAVVVASVFLGGEYDLEDVTLGVPVRLGRAGIEERIELSLTADEHKALTDSAHKVRESIYWLESNGFLGG